MFPGNTSKNLCGADVFDIAEADTFPVVLIEQPTVFNIYSTLP